MKNTKLKKKIEIIKNHYQKIPFLKKEKTSHKLGSGESGGTGVGKGDFCIHTRIKTQDSQEAIRKKTNEKTF
jgi:hypothetical protein